MRTSSRSAGSTVLGQVAPFDARHGALVELFEQAEVDHLAEPIEAVEVGVQQAEAAGPR